jgi:biopolymer transport protein ExbD
MRIRDDEDDDKPELNLAPLIDCLFFLLTFFIMTSTLQDVAEQKEKAPQQLAFDLPESAAASAVPAQPEPLVIGVDASGHCYVNNSRVGLEELHRALRAAAPKHPKIRIEGDGRAPFDDIAHVIDLCEFEGLREIAVRTRDK